MSSSAQQAMLGWNRPSLDAAMRRLLAQHAPGGVFLYGEALGEPEQVRALTAEIRRATLPRAFEGLPPLIAIDQEGGPLQAWGPPHVAPLPAPGELGRALARTGDPRPIVALAEQIGHKLASVGIDLDFAPVLDVNTCATNPIIGERSFGADPELATSAGCAFVEGLHRAGVLACGKHFPGHGDTTSDSHLTLPVVAQPLERLRSVELVPFAAAIERGLGAIMTAHVLYPAWDETQPATLSPAIVSGVLRRELGFEGIVVTDDLKMRGVRDRHDLSETALLALDAGCDVVLSCTEHDRHEELLAALAQADRDGRIPATRRAASLARIAAVKRRLLGRS